jgi:transposase
MRLTTLLKTFAVALSAEQASYLLAQLAIPTSGDTLLRLVKRSLLPAVETPKAIGVGDFALRRGKTYGTIVVDLLTHRPIDLLTERTAEALSHWLVEHPAVRFISRDRSSEYMRGATEGAPKAQQVLDRYHVLTNMREVVQRIVSRNHATLKEHQKDSGVIVRARYKKKRSSSELAASQVARLRRQAWYEEVVEHYRKGKSIAAIAELLQMRSLLWQEICQQGFSHGYKVVNTWLREYLGKPGRNSSEQEKAKRQAFFDAVQAEQRVGFPSEEMALGTTMQGENTPIVVEPLESPRHLTWLLLRDPESLKAQEREPTPLLRRSESLAYTSRKGGKGSCKKFRRRIQSSLSVRQCAWHRLQASQLHKSPVN